MIRSLLSVRLSRLQLLAVTAVSIAASVIIIADATGQSGLQAEVLAALHRRLVVHHVTPPSAPIGDPVRSASPVDQKSSSPSPSPTPASSPAPASTPSTPSTAGTPTTPTTPTTPATPTKGTPKPLKVKHVFVIALTTPSYQDAFGHGSPATYLQTLRKRGTLLSGYQTLGPQELPDALATVSGQPPNRDTRGGCADYVDFPSSAKADKAGVLAADGCVYPNSVLTIGDQMTSGGLSWKAYVEGQGKLPSIHPNDGAADNVALAGAGADYDTRHNPFIYFHSLLDLGDCSTDDLDLSRLKGALTAPRTTPNYAYIAPGACEDAAPPPTCPATAPTGLAAEDAFLKAVVPEILSSEAYKRDGALIIAFAASGAPAALTGPVQTGALVLSRYAVPGRTLTATYDPYSLLRTVEDIFAFTPLGRAAKATSFAAAALPLSTDSNTRRGT